VRILSFIILVLWLMALVRTIVNLLLVPRLKREMPRETPLVSVIIPARDEASIIGRTVRAMLAQTYPSLEVVVVNDRSVDATGEILRAIDDARLVVVSGEEPPAGWLGKPWALHQGATRARGELLLFVDADVQYSPDAVAAAVARLERSGLAMTALFPRFELHGFWEHIAMPNMAVFAFSLMPLWIGNRTRLRLMAAGGGPGNLVKRSEYEAAGGHEALKDAVVDDVALARLIRRGGHGTEFVRADDGFVSLRMYHGAREIIDGFTKNMFSVFGRNYLAVTIILIVTLAGNVLPLVLALTGDRIAIATLVVTSLTRLILFASLGYRLDNAIFGNVPMVLIWTFILLRSTWRTGIRRQLHWRGRTYDASGTRFGAD
jgi:glycosyltransferase involved in cell wall biosynthesis